MDVKKRASGKRPKKRHYHGKKSSKKQKTAILKSDVSDVLASSISENIDSECDKSSLLNSSAVEITTECASRKKLGGKDCLLLPNENIFGGKIIIDKSMLFAFLEENTSCKVCSGNIKVSDRRIMGLSSCISITCENCQKEASTRNSKLIGTKKNIPEINRRIVYAMRCIGQGLEPLKTFCGIMDLYPPVSQKSYDKICDKINLAAKAVASYSMINAAKEEIEANSSTDITVSGDGTWKTRGHTSQIGVCTVIGSDTGKVLDVEVLSSSCRGCHTWKGPRSGVSFDEWNAKHSAICSKNHTGSSGKMEADGMVNIFKRSVQDRGVRYTKYIGDGDCKTFLSITESKPYSDTNVTKLECVGHVQKRMGTRLRKLKQEYGAKKLSDKKSISGKGRLTDALINQLSLYYGNAIREHSHSLKDMRNAIWAIYFHTRSTDAEPIHNFCPTGSETWCKYQKAVLDGTVSSFHHKTSVPAAIMEIIKPVFNALSHPTLLTRCLGAFTQNANESFNSMIWSLCPKTSGCGRRIVEIAVYEAAIIFNEGRRGRLDLMEELGLQIGNHAISAQQQTDSLRLINADKRASLNTVEARRAKRNKKMSSNLKNIRKEGNMYEPGGF